MVNDLESVLLRYRNRLALFVEPDHYRNTTIFEIERVSVAL